MKSALAEAIALQGDLDHGLRLVNECLEQIERPGWEERWHLAEILRLKGWMLTRQRSNPFFSYMLQRIDDFVAPAGPAH